MKNKIFVGLSVIILIGIIVIAVFGFNVDFSYKNYHLIDIKIGQDYNISDIKAITNEVFANQNIEIQKAGVYNDNVVIKVNEINDEQKNTLNTKINEKFGLENTLEDVKVNYIPSFRLRDIVKPYVVPMVIATAIIFLYMAIRFRKIGSIKVVTQAAVLTIIAELLYIAIIAITRYPVNRLVLPVGVVIYITILTVLNGMFEKQTSMKA